MRTSHGNLTSVSFTEFGIFNQILRRFIKFCIKVFCIPESVDIMKCVVSRGGNLTHVSAEGGGIYVL